MTDALLTTASLAGAGVVLYFTYRQDIKEHRYFAAVRRAALVPYENRDWHRRFAERHKLFWKPCPVCLRPFGGHEMTGKTIPHRNPELARKGNREPICPPCSDDRRPPATSSKQYQGKALRKGAKG